jgi:hypothetical protein
MYCSAAYRALAWRRSRRTRVRAAAVKAGLTAVRPVCSASLLVGVEHRVEAVYCSAARRARGWRARQVASVERAECER